MTTWRMDHLCSGSACRQPSRTSCSFGPTAPQRAIAFALNGSGTAPVALYFSSFAPIMSPQGSFLRSRALHSMQPTAHTSAPGPTAPSPSCTGAMKVRVPPGDEARFTLSSPSPASPRSASCEQKGGDGGAL